MKQFYKGSYLLGAAICCAVLLFAYSKISFFIPTQTTCTFSGSFCRGQKTKIKDFVSGEISKKHKALYKLCLVVQKKFPSIAHLALARTVSGQLVVTIQSVHPLFMVNDTFVLTSCDGLFNKLLFDNAVLKNLPCISCATIKKISELALLEDLQKNFSAQLPENFLKTAQQIPADRFAQYSVECEDTITWRLCDKQKTNFSILCTKKTISDERLLAACNKIKGTLSARDNRFARGIRPWVTDTRFEDQIILFRKTGGR